MAGIVDDGLPLALCFADDNGIGIQRRLVRAERCVKAAQHDRHAALPIFSGDLVGAPRRIRLDADRDEVGFLIEWNRFEPIVVKADIDVVGRQAREDGRGQRFHLPASYVFLIARPASDAGMDQCQPETL